MANENYEQTLELFKKLQQGGTTDVSVQQHTNRTPKGVTGSIDSLDEAVFGRYIETEDDETSKGQRLLMETMREYEEGNVSEETMERVKHNVKNLKIPQAIISSVISNPLIETKIGGDDIDEFVEKNLKKNTNIELSNRITKKLEEKDNKTQRPQPQPQQQRTDSQLAQMITEAVGIAIDRKLSQIGGKINLNESQNRNIPSLKMIQETDGSKFLLLDSDDNVYECTLTYKGKNKKR